MIDDSKFAPKKQLETDFSEDSECPICFLNYVALNEALCCKQMICTDCYLLMKHTAIQAVVKCPCPFCSTEVLNIIYRPNHMKPPPSAPVSPRIPIIDIPSSVSSPSPSQSSISKTDNDESSSSNDGSLSARACMRKVPHDINVPKSSMADRKDIENEIQQQRTRFADDQPPPLPPSARTRAGDAYLESLSQSFTRRSLLNNNADMNNPRGTMSDFEHASLRLRFAVAMGERNSERLSQRLIMQHQNEMNMNSNGRSLSPARVTREQDVMSEYLHSSVVGRRNNNDLERIEEMMMMEVCS